MNPKAFVCHASEDKERFVIGFAEKLRRNGVDAWLDKWEMLPGDSVVDKIFEEGIKNAETVIVIISKYSVDKKWVREELNAAFVKKINHGSRLIPIIIDDVNVPECLKTTLWVSIDNLEDYDKHFSRIRDSIYGLTDKPPLGNTPAIASNPIKQIANLTKLDSLIIKTACDIAMNKGEPNINSAEVYDKLKDEGISEESFFESLEILNARRHIKGVKVPRGIIPHFSISSFVFEEYANVYIDKYNEITRNIMYYISNTKNQMSTATIVQDLHFPKRLVNHILEILDERELVKLVKAIGGICIIVNVSPELRRML